MSERVYNGTNVSGSGDDILRFYKVDKHRREDDLHDIINAQNERIADLEAQVAGLVESKGETNAI